MYANAHKETSMDIDFFLFMQQGYLMHF